MEIDAARACMGGAFLLEIGRFSGNEVSSKPRLATDRDQVLIWGAIEVSNRGPAQSLEEKEAEE
jgi:hypothetical protein